MTRLAYAIELLRQARQAMVENRNCKIGWGISQIRAMVAIDEFLGLPEKEPEPPSEKEATCS